MEIGVGYGHSSTRKAPQALVSSLPTNDHDGIPFSAVSILYPMLFRHRNSLQAGCPASRIPLDRDILLRMSPGRFRGPEPRGRSQMRRRIKPKMLLVAKELETVLVVIGISVNPTAPKVLHPFRIGFRLVGMGLNLDRPREQFANGFPARRLVGSLNVPICKM